MGGDNNKIKPNLGSKPNIMSSNSIFNKDENAKDKDNFQASANFGLNKNNNLSKNTLSSKDFKAEQNDKDDTINQNAILQSKPNMISLKKPSEPKGLISISNLNTSEVEGVAAKKIGPPGSKPMIGGMKKVETKPKNYNYNYNAQAPFIPGLESKSNS